ncbi:MAG: hypothetical protein ACLFMT_07250 [Halobacteriales archaeon]
MSDDELDRLREQTRSTDRIDAEEDGDDGVDADVDSGETSDTSEDFEPPEPHEEFERRLARVVSEVRRAERPRTFSASDPVLSAFFQALGRDEDARSEVGEALERLAGEEAGDRTRSNGYSRDDLVRLAALAGVRQAAPAYYEDVGALSDER